MQHRVASPWLAGARKAKPRNAREKGRRSKATPGKARKHNTAQHNTGVKIGIAVGASRDSLRSPRSALTQQKHAKVRHPSKIPKNCKKQPKMLKNSKKQQKNSKKTMRHFGNDHCHVLRGPKYQKDSQALPKASQNPSKSVPKVSPDPPKMPPRSNFASKSLKCPKNPIFEPTRPRKPSQKYIPNPPKIL